MYEVAGPRGYIRAHKLTRNPFATDILIVHTQLISLLKDYFNLFKPR